MVGCSESFDESTIVDGANDGYATLTLSGGVQTKVAYAYEAGTAITASWESGDQISLFDSTQGHVAEFEYTSTDDSGNAIFTSVVACDPIEGDNYEIIYPARETYPDDFTLGSGLTLEQSASGDTSHLDDAIVFASGEFIYGTSGLVTLNAQQCVIVASVVNIGNVTPTSVTYTAGNTVVTLELLSYSGGDVKFFIPADPQTRGVATTFVIAYDGTPNNMTTTEAGNIKTFTVTTSQDQAIGGVYNLTLDVDNPFTNYDAGTPSATSGEDTIILPLGLEISSVGDLSDYSISVANDSYGGEQAIAIKTIEASGSDLILTLSSPIYNDDVVLISYNGTSTKMSDDKTALNTFSAKQLTPEGTNIIGSDYLDMYSFEDAGSNNWGSNEKAFYIYATDEASTGSNVLYYSYDNSVANSTLASSIVSQYYVGSKVSYTTIYKAQKQAYVARFDCKILECDGSLDGAISLRSRATLNGTTTFNYVETVVDFSGVEVGGDWGTIDVEYSFAEQAWGDDDDYNAYIAFLTTSVASLKSGSSSVYVTSTDAEFYIDNVRVYEKSALQRTERIATVSGGIGVDDMGIGDNDGTF